MTAASNAVKFRDHNIRVCGLVCKKKGKKKRKKRNRKKRGDQKQERESGKAEPSAESPDSVSPKPPDHDRSGSASAYL